SALLILSALSRTLDNTDISGRVFILPTEFNPSKEIEFPTFAIGLRSTTGGVFTLGSKLDCGFILSARRFMLHNMPLNKPIQIRGTAAITVFAMASLLLIAS